jgi:hypothetical protein
VEGDCAGVAGGALMAHLREGRRREEKGGCRGGGGQRDGQGKGRWREVGEGPDSEPQLSAAVREGRGKMGRWC